MANEMEDQRSADPSIPMAIEYFADSTQPSVRLLRPLAILILVAAIASLIAAPTYIYSALDQRLYQRDYFLTWILVGVYSMHAMLGALSVVAAIGIRLPRNRRRGLLAQCLFEGRKSNSLLRGRTSSRRGGRILP